MSRFSPSCKFDVAEPEPDRGESACVWPCARAPLSPSMSGDHSNNFDNNTLALLNRIANNRRTNLAPEAILQQPARASRGGDSATRSKQHALFGDGGTRRTGGAPEAPHRPGTAQVRDPFHRASAVAPRPASAAQGARNAAASRTTGSSLRAGMPMVADDTAQSAFSGAAGGLWAGMQANGGGGDGSGGSSCSCGSRGNPNPNPNPGPNSNPNPNLNPNPNPNPNQVAGAAASGAARRRRRRGAVMGSPSPRR